VRTFLLAAAFAAATPVCGAAAELVLRADLSLHGPVLRLNDVLNAASRERLEGSRTAALGRVPLVTLGLDAVPFALSASDVAERMSRNVPGGLGPWRLASGQVLVRPQTAPLDAGQRAALLEVVEAAWQRQCSLSGGIDCHARARLVGEAMPRVPAGAVEFDVRAPLRPMDATGEIEMPAAVRVDGVTIGRLPVLVAWAAQREAVHLRQSVALGDALRTDDLVPVRASAHGVEHGALAYDSRAGVVRATRALAAGAVLPAVDPAFTALYRRGDPVLVRFDVGHVNVVRQGVAVQDARAGRSAFVQLGEEPARVRMPTAAIKDRTHP
jgi:hypothetical protein